MTGKFRRWTVAPLLAALLVMTIGCESAGYPPPVPPDTSGWSSAVATMDQRPVRVVVIADSMGELSIGWRAVWEQFHRDVTTEPIGQWWAPRKFNSWLQWEPVTGTPVEAGLELRGQSFEAGMAATGSPDRMAIPTTMDLYYSAQPGGATLEVRIGGELVGTIDTSLDEFGQPVTGVVESQRWRSPHVGAWRTWSVTPVGQGSAIVEAASFPPSRGIELHGTGRSGASTRQLLDSGYAIGHIEAMTARGEPPDLVLWAADTADVPDRAEQARALLEALTATRAAAPGATIAHYIPTGHNNRADWAEWADMYRAIDGAYGVLVIDGYEGLGDVSNLADPEDYSSDGVHLNADGQERATQLFLEVLRGAA